MTHQKPVTVEPKPKRQPRGVQPTKQAPKNAVAVKARRKIFVNELLKGTPAKEAGIIAGFSPATAASQVSQTLKNPKFQNSIHAAMERLGMTDAYLAQQHRALIEGTKVISANIIAFGSGSDLADAGSMTKDFIEVPDNIARAKGLEMIYKLTGRFMERHEVDVKQPIQIVIRKFCSRGKPPDGSGTGEGGT